MNSGGLDREWTRRKLPASCIESACHAIQCIASGSWSTWSSSNTTTKGPGVWAAFGNRFICVSRVSNLADLLTGVTNFDDLGAPGIAGMLKVGRGIMLANSQKGDSSFNMHLGAIIQNTGGTLYITDMSEDGEIAREPIVTATFKSSEIISGFRGADYGDPVVFKAGLLICEADSGFSAVSKKYGPKQIFDEA